jgi:hypothetical protein
MISTAVGFVLCPSRGRLRIWPAALAFALFSCSEFCTYSQEPAPVTPPPQIGQEPTGQSQDSSAAHNPGDPANPIAIVPIEAANRDQAQVTGGLQVTKGTAFILSSGTVTSGSMTTNVVLPRRGVLRVCASTTVHVAADKSVPAGETPGLMLALDRGAVEASFATGKNSDVVLTPDFRILIGGPGAAEVKIRLGQHGDTCVDNPGANAPYVLVSGVFEGGAYRVQPGQRVMFQHGSLNEVVDQEKEPCGCPPEARPETNDFPMAQSAGLVPLERPAPVPQPGVAVPGVPQQVSEPLVYSAASSPATEPDTRSTQAATPAPALPASAPAATTVAPDAQAIAAATAPVAMPAPAATATPPAPKKNPGFFRSVGRFFKKIFGAE